MRNVQNPEPEFCRLSLRTKLILFLGILVSLTPAREVVYQEDTTNFPNPERGFAPAYEAPWPPLVTWGFCGDPSNFANYSWTAWTPPLTPQKLKPFRDQGMSVVMMRYHIAEFRGQPISQAFLNRLAEDFAVARGGI